MINKIVHIGGRKLVWLSNASHLKRRKSWSSIMMVQFELFIDMINGIIHVNIYIYKINLLEFNIYNHLLLTN